MKNFQPVDRLFSIPCFEGLRLLRNYAVQNLDTETEDLISRINYVEADAPNLDMEAAGHLHKLVEPTSPLDGPVFYQNCIKAIVVNHQPVWVKLMSQGRVRFVQALERDHQDIFHAAGLLEKPPSAEVVRWWDDIAGKARLETDRAKMIQARAAEAMTIENEKSRLDDIGISKNPEWIGLDDNFAGYDVLSFDLIDNFEVNRLIEVKSTKGQPLRFFITRNEWEVAKKFGDAYFFHIWDMAANPPILYEKTIEDISPHIPSDNAADKWSDVEIRLRN